MALQPISTIKGWFLRGKKPLQQQFWDWLDSYWHKSEAIPISAVDGLQDALDSGGSGGGVTDGDKGDIVVSSSGTIWELGEAVVLPIHLAPQSVTSAALQLVPGLSSGTYEDATVEVNDKGRVLSIKGRVSSDLTTLNGVNPEGIMKVFYRGALPVLTRDSLGNYTLTEPVGCRLLNFRWVSNEYNGFESGMLTLAIVSANGADRFIQCDTRAKADGRKVDDLNGLSDLETNPTPGTVVYEWQNISTLSGGFILNAKFL